MPSEAKILIFSEICWPPLGMVYSLTGPSPLIGKMSDISAWGHYDFNQTTTLNFSVPQFRVEVNSPLAFGTAAEHRSWEERSGRIQLLVRNTEADQPTQICTLIKRENRLPKRRRRRTYDRRTICLAIGSIRFVPLKRQQKRWGTSGGTDRIPPRGKGSYSIWRQRYDSEQFESRVPLENCLNVDGIQKWMPFCVS
jgi:hypothetical protein